MGGFVVAAPVGLHGSARGSLRAVSWSQESIRKARGCCMAAPPLQRSPGPPEGSGGDIVARFKGGPWNTHGVPGGGEILLTCCHFTALLPTEVSRRSLDQLANSTSLHLSFLVFS